MSVPFYPPYYDSPAEAREALLAFERSFMIASFEFEQPGSSSYFTNVTLRAAGGHRISVVLPIDEETRRYFRELSHRITNGIRLGEPERTMLDLYAEHER